jgi:hypothetical protein
VPPLESAEERWITTFFDYVDARVSFLSSLWHDGRQDEALTLCCCYLDALAKSVYRDVTSGAERFARLLIEYASDDLFRAHNAKTFRRWVEGQGANFKQKFGHSAARISACIGDPESRLLTPNAFHEYAVSALGQVDYERISRHLWRGSTGWVIYKHLRSPFVHSFWGPGAVVMGPSDVPEEERELVSFPRLHAELQALSASFRSRSLRDQRLP